MKEIPLTREKIALVDDSDFARVICYKWYAYPEQGGHWYAVRDMRNNGKRQFVSMHRFILAPPPGVVVDHINMDGLDNRRENLRLCSHAENMRNHKKMLNTISRFKGVTWECNKWRVRINSNGKLLHLGLYESEEDAARVYDAAARKFYGEFARTNFPATQENLSDLVVESQELLHQQRGVSWNKNSKKWVAYGGLNGKRIHLGYFLSQDEALAVAAKFRTEKGTPWWKRI